MSELLLSRMGQRPTLPLSQPGMCGVCGESCVLPGRIRALLPAGRAAASSPSRIQERDAAAPGPALCRISQAPADDGQVPSGRCLRWWGDPCPVSARGRPGLGAGRRSASCAAPAVGEGTCWWHPRLLGRGKQRGDTFWVGVEGTAGASLAWGRVAEPCPLLAPSRARPHCAAPSPAPQSPFVRVAAAPCQLLAAAGTATPSRQSRCGAGSGPRTSLTAEAGRQHPGMDAAPFLLGLLPGLGFPAFVAPVASWGAPASMPRELLGGTLNVGVCSRWGAGTCVPPSQSQNVGMPGVVAAPLCAVGGGHPMGSPPHRALQGLPISPRAALRPG